MKMSRKFITAGVAGVMALGIAVSSDAEAVADPHADRADDEGGQRANDDHAEERHEDQLDAPR